MPDAGYFMSLAAPQPYHTVPAQLCKARVGMTLSAAEHIRIIPE